MWQRLRKIWRSKQISIPLKMKLFQSIVVPTAIYACESWRSASTKETVQMLDTFQRRCLRTILGISWRDHVSNEELMQRAKVPSLSATVMKMRLSFAGHVWRLPDLRTTKTALTWKPEGTRPRGRPRVTLRKTLQNDGVKLGLNSYMAVVAQDRNLWRQKVRQGVDLCNKVAGGSKQDEVCEFEELERRWGGMVLRVGRLNHPSICGSRIRNGK
ncbi:hypothetical protein Bbelb_097740 [Branchiostoma belcheri]|nr:hypothetical protein Bbelb_097740 [Branchiostoma belcheri]